MKQSLSWFRHSHSLVMLLLIGIITACVGHFLPDADGERAALERSGYGDPAIRTGGQEYPRQAVDSDSFVVRVARPAQRIVSQYPSIDEFLYSIVPPERIVAVSENAYQEQTSNVYAQVQRYHPAMATDPEQVLRLSPDLLMVSNSSRADFCALMRSAQIPIYRTFTMFTTLEQVAEAMRLTGYLTGEDVAAAEQIRQFWNDINLAKARRPPGAHRPRILGLGGNYSYGDETLFHDIVSTLGGINVGAEGGLKGYDQVDTEQIARWNPEWIVAGADEGKADETLASLLADPGIASTQAARNRHILTFDQRIFLTTSPYARLLVTALAQALYG
jgi:iron complex transport system substrate-binding protein